MINLAVVTAAWGDYGGFLPEWAESVAAQSVRPANVVIVDSGLNDRAPAVRAGRDLRAAGLNATVSRPIPHRGIGAAVNEAVRRVNTEWVIRLDADDTLLPHCIADVAELADQADVVAIGAVRDGQEILWPNVSAEWILSGRQGAMSSSAFRRRLWKAAPFIEANDWIESAFWVGCAHQGARFVPTTRPGFIYRRWSGSHSATISPADKASARRQHLELCASWNPA